MERLELGPVGFDLRQLRTSRDQHRIGARAVRDWQQLSDLRQRETERLRPADEPQPGNIVVGVLAVLGTSAYRTFEEPAALVVADRFDTDVGRASEIADRERAHPTTIPPVPGYGVKALEPLTPYLGTARTVSPMNVTQLTDSTFDEFASGAELPLLVEFTANWCGPCNMLAPVLHELANEQSADLRVAQIDVDDNASITRRYDVMSMPTLILFVDGRERRRLVGARSKARLLQEIAEHLPSRI